MKKMAANTPKPKKQQEQIYLTADNNYTDPNNGILYDLKISKNFDTCTVSFKSEDKFNQLTNLLKSHYTLSQNLKCKSLSTSIEVDSRKVKLTHCATRKLMIQGTGCWTWRNTVFRELSKCLSETNADNSSINKGTSMPTARTEEQPSVLDSPKSLNSKPPAETDDIRDYDNKHNGSLYDIASSNNGDCFTAIFYTDQTFKEITELLEHEYKFQPNKDNNGQEADVLLYDKKVVLNLYKNKKMVIQGAGSKLWRNSVYHMLTDKLRPRQSLSIKTEHSLDEITDEVVCTYVETPVKHTQKGPVKNTLNKMINKVCSQGASIKPKRKNEPIQIPDEMDESSARTIFGETGHNSKQ